MKYEKKHVNLPHARTDKQRKVMERIIRDGKCPFCLENLTLYHTEPIIIRGKWWVVTTNFEPYEGAKYHFLILNRKHIENLLDIEPGAAAELFSLLEQLKKRYTLKGGSLLMRFGDTDMTGATVTHLHAHFVVGASRSESKEKLKTTLGYKLPNKK